MQVDFETRRNSYLKRVKNKFEDMHVAMFVDNLISYDQEFEQLIIDQIPNYDPDNEDHINLWNEKCHELADMICHAIKR